MGEKHDAAEARWYGGAAYAPIAESEKRWGAREQGLSLLKQALGTEDVGGLLERAGGEAGVTAKTELGKTTGLEMTPLGYDPMVARMGAGGVDAYTKKGEDPLWKQEALRVDPISLVKAQSETSQFKIAQNLLQRGEAGLLTPEERAKAVNEGNRGAILAEAQEKYLTAPIVESAGIAMKESMKNLNDALGRGGGARRTALRAMEQMDTHARLMGERMQNLSNARLSLSIYNTQLAQQAVSFADAWAESVPGLDAATNQALDAVGQTFLSNSLPVIIDTRNRGAAIRAQMHADNRARANQIYTGAAGIAALVAAPFTGGATTGLGLSLLGSAISPSSGIAPTVEQAQQAWTGGEEGRGIEDLLRAGAGKVGGLVGGLFGG